MKRSTSISTPSVHSACSVTRRSVRSWTVIVLIAALLPSMTTALATVSNDGPSIQFADVRESLIDIEIESTRLGLVSAAALQGDRASFVELEFATQTIQQESAKLDARRLESLRPWTTQSNWSSLRTDIQSVIDAQDTILQNVDAAFQLKLQLDGLSFSFLHMAMKPDAIHKDSPRVFALMDSAMKLEAMSSSISILMSRSRESGLARLSLPRAMGSVEENLTALIHGSKELDITAETDLDVRKKLEEVRMELTSAFTTTKTLLETTQNLLEVSEASSRIAKEADDLAALARATRTQLANK